MTMEMEYRRLGKSGLKVSALSFGSWATFDAQLDVEEAEVCMKMAYDAGVNFFDNAEMYANGASEEIMGTVLKKSGWRRDSYCVSSKVRWGCVENPLPTQVGLSRKHVIEACEQAMQRLGVDYLDLYFCHRPDDETPMEETVRAMHTLVEQGKVLYWGTSHFSALEIMEMHSAARQFGLTPPTIEQPLYNMFDREKVEKEFCRLYDEIGLGTTVFSPLAGGVLTGKYSDGIPEGSRMSLEGFEFMRRYYASDDGKPCIEKAIKLKPIAEDLGTSLAQLALAWILKNPNVSTIILGASRPEQLTDNLGALGVVGQLTDDVLTSIEDVLENKPV